jgi:hypothetical protein
MSWFRNEAERASQTDAWVGPFAPAPPTGPAQFNPMVRTAAQLVATDDGVASGPIAAPAHSVAA